MEKRYYTDQLRQLTKRVFCLLVMGFCFFSSVIYAQVEPVSGLENQSNEAMLPSMWWVSVIGLLLLVLLIFLLGWWLIVRERERTKQKEQQLLKDIDKAQEKLQVIQQQLIQQEKLASLGQLAAGIAHEIKNPLNFVNNFSELSLEYIEEINEYLDKQKDDEVKAEIKILLNDVSANLTKILQHGSRADGIVRSMLMHSRGGKSIKEAVDLNELIREYVNLAFHGMRANKNPINVTIEYDLEDGMDKLLLYPEDFSRVILNLCKNAFDAMREKLDTIAKIDASEGNRPPAYGPKLLVRSREIKDKVQIQIEDNGPGISEAIKDKLLMPFFTTKKGTEGTGLGLSITNDIVKNHDGTLEVESEIGEFTRFNILLPKNT
ncbi:sensor histidine kinase [Pararhodonellum marinum]|uniref:sensor histidine kinase n=1 Tax=Pararhodonellum marinum TaxID=2755358 RepID=UPI00188E6F38|nr:ATP-binding protein [Pararhodonellum marinum]